jgi:hypothetical protein
MMCSTCGTKYKKDDATWQFESRMNGLSYFQEIDDKLCGDCAVDFMVKKIEGQPGYLEYYAERGEQPPSLY